MKRLLGYLLLIWLFAGRVALAQDQPVQTNTVVHTRTISTPLKLDTNRVVYDEQGNELKYYQYQKLLNTGEYTLRSNGQPGATGTKMYLKKMTDLEHFKMFQMIKPMITNKSPELQEGKVLNTDPLFDVATKAEMDHKVIVMIFWYANCPPCTESFDSLNEFFKQIHNPENIIIMAITRDNDLTAAAKLKEKPLKYARLISSAGKIVQDYRNTQFPAFVVTDNDHIIRSSLTGVSPVTISEIKNCIRSVLFE